MLPSSGPCEGLITNDDRWIANDDRCQRDERTGQSDREKDQPAEGCPRGLAEHFIETELLT